MMFVDKDERGEISIQSLTKEDAEMIVDCICSYFSERPVNGRTDPERHMIMLKIQLEKLI